MTPQQTAVIWDRGKTGSVRGLHIRVFPDKKVFYLFYRTRQGRQRRPKIGVVGEITLQEARRRAKLILEVVCAGHDPGQQWQRSKDEMTVGGLFDKLYQEYWSTKRFVISGYSKEVKRSYESHIAPTFHTDKLSEITPDRLMDWHQAKHRTPVAANRALEVFSKMFKLAQAHEWVPRNPCIHVPAFTEKKRHRYATEEEISKLGTVLEEEARENPRAAAFIYLLIFSGSRPRAIERATWDDLEIHEKGGRTYGILTLNGKGSAASGEQERIVLPPQAMALLATLPKDTETITGMKLPRKMWDRVRERAGCRDLWARDWRRTFATIGLSSGVKEGVVGELLNHKSAQTTKRYAKLLPNERILGVEQIAGRLEGLLHGHK